MNILYTLAESSISGANKSMCILAEYMLKKNNNVIVILPKHGDIEKELNDRKIKYYIVKSYQWIRSLDDNTLITTIKLFLKKVLNVVSIIKIKKIIKQNNINILHNNSSSSYVGVVAAKKSNIKIVWHFREFLEEDHGLKISNIFNHKKIINSSDKMIAISKCIYDKFSKIYDKNKMVLIYNGINTQDFQYVKRLFNNEEITISIIGRVSEGKGQFEFVKAIDMVNKKINNINAQIIGYNDNEYADKIRKYIENKKINNINFIEPTKDIIKYYKNSDIIVVSSRCEAFGRVTIEGMLTSNLVIGADTGGTKELIDDKKTGLLYESGNYVDLADKIIYSIHNKEKMNGVVEKARTNSIKNFNSELNAKNIEKIYKSLC